MWPFTAGLRRLGWTSSGVATRAMIRSCHNKDASIRRRLETSFKTVEEMTLKQSGEKLSWNSSKKELVKMMSSPSGTLDESWADAFARNPRLFGAKHSRIRDLAAEMRANGAAEDKVAGFFGSLPATYLADRAKYQALGNNLPQWVSFAECKGFDWLQVLTMVPAVLLLNPVMWMERMEDLKPIFHQCFPILVTESPNIFLESWPQLEQKLKLLKEDMHVSAKSISLTGALSYDFDHINVRFRLLDRAGIYKHPRSGDIGLNVRAEPLLDKILEGSDEKFLRRTTAGTLTELDFNTFREILKMEQEDDDVEGDFIQDEDDEDEDTEDTDEKSR